MVYSLCVAMQHGEPPLRSAGDSVAAWLPPIHALSLSNHMAMALTKKSQLAPATASVTTPVLATAQAGY